MLQARPEQRVTMEPQGLLGQPAVPVLQDLPAQLARRAVTAPMALKALREQPEQQGLPDPRGQPG